jgi:hypothetical protein
MRAERSLLAVGFLAAGIFIIASSIPIVLSGVGGITEHHSPTTTNVVVFGYSAHIEPAPVLFGFALMVGGVWVLRQSIRILKIDTSRKAAMPPGYFH